MPPSTSSCAVAHRPPRLIGLGATHDEVVAPAHDPVRAPVSFRRRVGRRDVAARIVIGTSARRSGRPRGSSRRPTRRQPGASCCRADPRGAAEFRGADPSGRDYASVRDEVSGCEAASSLGQPRTRIPLLVRVPARLLGLTSRRPACGIGAVGSATLWARSRGTGLGGSPRSVSSPVAATTSAHSGIDDMSRIASRRRVQALEGEDSYGSGSELAPSWPRSR